MNLGHIGLGTFPFSNVFGSITSAEAEAVVHTFLDEGGRYIQTAPYYEGVDPLMGGILSKVDRGSYHLGTLCAKDRESTLSGTRAAIFRQCEDSLRHLKIDHIDLYMTSTPEVTDAKFGETISAMEDLQREGKVLEIGVCNVTLAQLLEYNAAGSVRYVQNRFSILDQEADLEVRQYCAKHGIGLVPYNVIEWGLLTSKILGPLSLREGDLRKRVLPVFSEAPVQEIQRWVQECVLPISTEHETTIEALAIGWVINQSAVTVCPVGATSRDQIKSSLRGRELLGKSEVIKRMDDAYREFEQRIQRSHGTSVNQFLRNSYGLW